MTDAALKTMLLFGNYIFVVATLGCIILSIVSQEVYKVNNEIEEEGK